MNLEKIKLELEINSELYKYSRAEINIVFIFFINFFRYLATNFFSKVVRKMDRFVSAGHSDL